MANKQLNVRIRNKYDTEANWIASDIVLMPGEVAYVVDSLEHPTNLMAKVGDGATSFQELPYLSHPITELQDEVQQAVEAEFDKKFNNGILIQCGGPDFDIEPPKILTEEAINEAVNNVLADILNTQY